MILFGTAGIPISAKGKSAQAGVREIKRLGLDCMEVEFVRGVRMSDQTAAALKQAARENNVALTAHAPYYINLCSKDREKAEASALRIMAAARAAHNFGGQSVTFHAAFYEGRDPKVVFDTVAKRLGKIVQELAGQGIDVAIAPELTGKPSQFGSLDELILLGKTVKGVRPCIDFSHLAARGQGADNSYEGFCRAISRIRKGLGKKEIQRLHMHASGIEWGPKGEIRHKPIAESDFDWKAMIRALADQGVSGILICESPVLERDALALKKEYLRTLKRNKK